MVLPIQRELAAYPHTNSNTVLSTTVAYLTLNDYLPSIQSGQLNNQLLDAVTAGGSQQRQFAESWSIGKALSMLGDYFDFSNELTPTLPFNFSKTYYPGNRVVIDFQDWIASSNSETEGDTTIVQYSVGDCVIYNGVGYCCKSQNQDTQFLQNNWTAIGNQYDIYFLPYSQPLFQLEVLSRRGLVVDGFYSVGNKIYFNQRLWQCIIGTGGLSHQSSEQYLNTSDIPPANTFPQLGSQFEKTGTGSRDNSQWKDLGEYSFKGELPFNPSTPTFGKNVSTAGTITSESILDGADNEVQLGAVPIKDTVWTLGDNRDSVFLQAIVDMSIWRLCSRIAPNNIPKLRDDNFRQTWSWLTAVQKGEQSISIPKIMPTQVGDISGGSSPRVINRLR